MEKIIYILINPAMEGLVKIGITDNLEERIRVLSGSSSVPLPFQCYYAKKLENAEIIEKQIHFAFSDYRINQSREFFEIDPIKPKAIISAFPGIDVTPLSENFLEKEDLKVINEYRKKRKPFRFDLVGIKPGEILYFVEDKSIQAIVKNSKEIVFNNKSTSLSAAAQEIKGSQSLQGPLYWTYNDETLESLRRRLEGGDL